MNYLPWQSVKQAKWQGACSFVGEALAVSHACMYITASLSFPSPSPTLIHLSFSLSLHPFSHTHTNKTRIHTPGGRDEELCGAMGPTSRVPVSVTFGEGRGRENRREQSAGAVPAVTALQSDSGLLPLKGPQSSQWWRALPSHPHIHTYTRTHCPHPHPPAGEC